jgi:hypothetical protein
MVRVRVVDRDRWRIAGACWPQRRDWQIFQPHRLLDERPGGAAFTEQVLPFLVINEHRGDATRSLGEPLSQRIYRLVRDTRNCDQSVGEVVDVAVGPRWQSDSPRCLDP